MPSYVNFPIGQKEKIKVCEIKFSNQKYQQKELHPFDIPQPRSQSEFANATKCRPPQCQIINTRSGLPTFLTKLLLCAKLLKMRHKVHSCSHPQCTPSSSMACLCPSSTVRLKDRSHQHSHRLSGTALLKEIYA